jgi:hypothetical protein
VRVSCSRVLAAVPGLYGRFSWQHLSPLSDSICLSSFHFSFGDMDAASVDEGGETAGARKQSFVAFVYGVRPSANRKSIRLLRRPFRQRPWNVASRSPLMPSSAVTVRST